MKVKSESEVVQSYLTLSDPMDCSLPGSSIHEIFQERVLEWVAIAFSIGLVYFYAKNAILKEVNQITKREKRWERRRKVKNRRKTETSPAVQCLRLRPTTTEGVGLNPSRGTKIPHALQHSQKEKIKKIFF